MTNISADEQAAVHAQRGLVLRAAGVCALVGTLAHLVAGVLHGALTAGTSQSSSAIIYHHVLATPPWAAVNLVSLLALLVWLAVFVALDCSSRSSLTWRGWLGRLASIVLGLGIAAATLLYLTDVVTVPALAEQWATAGPDRRAQLELLGDTVQIAIRIPLFHTLPILVFGLPFALLGAAHIGQDGVLPTWLGWASLVAGTTSLITGLSWSLGTTAIPELILWAGIQPLIWIWGLGAGVALWRTASRHLPERRDSVPRNAGAT